MLRPINWQGALRNALTVAGFGIAAVLIHGYHYGADDQAIYVPAIKKNLNPELYSVDAFFFLAQTQLTLWDEFMAWVVRLTGIPLEWALFLGYMLTAGLILLALLKLAQRTFDSRAVQWAAVITVLGVLPLHASLTRVHIVDQYLHPRGMATALVLFALLAVLDRKPRALAWMAAAAVLHPQMAAFGGFHLAVLAGMMAWQRSAKTEMEPAELARAAAMPLIPWAPSNEAWEIVSATRAHHYPLQWPWYGWLGAVVPIAALGGLWRWSAKQGQQERALVCRSFFVSGAIGVAIAVAIDLVPGLERLVTVQFMRILHLLYIIFVLMVGGWIASQLLPQRKVAWVLVLVTISAPAVVGYRLYFAENPHIEWPGKVADNPWAQAYDWARRNTPEQAIFALDPDYLESEGAGHYGFRALAERSALAEYSKDRAVAGLMPEAAPAFVQQISAIRNWKKFEAEDFRRLKRRYGVEWVVLSGAHRPRLECPYDNGVVRVCRID